MSRSHTIAAVAGLFGVGYLFVSMQAASASVPLVGPQVSGDSVGDGTVTAGQNSGGNGEPYSGSPESSSSVLDAITNDPSTWPAGDNVWSVCRAIARAEGANIAGSVPDTCNNPGDISDGGLTYGSSFHSGSFVTTFPDKMTGWVWLYNKVSNIIAGGSSVYPASGSIAEIGKIWAGNSAAWSNNVAAALGVSTDTGLADYVQSAG